MEGSCCRRAQRFSPTQGRRESLKTFDSAPHFVVRRAIRGSRACVLGGTESGASPGWSGGGLVFFEPRFFEPRFLGLRFCGLVE